MSAPAVPAPEPCVVYVDTDNQPHRLAQVLLQALRARGMQVLRVHLFGNNAGWALTQWHAQLLREPATTRCVHAHPVPCVAEAGDADLILTLGEQLQRLQADHTGVVLVSRDSSLIACAQRLNARGVRCLLACINPPALPERVQALALQDPLASVPALPPPRAGLLARLRANARPAPGGGYLKSSVCALLRSAGLDGPARQQFLQQLPDLVMRPVDGDTALEF